LTNHARVRGVDFAFEVQDGGWAPSVDVQLRPSAVNGKARPWVFVCVRRVHVAYSSHVIVPIRGGEQNKQFARRPARSGNRWLGAQPPVQSLAPSPVAGSPEIIRQPAVTNIEDQVR
jgi:hypothetical protein